AFDPVSGRVSGSLTPVTQGSRIVRSGDISPDGKWIVYDTSLPQEDLFITSLDGQQVRQITNDPERDRIPRWSPDGERILFYSDRGDEDYQVWSIRADGGDRRQMTAVAGDNAVDSLWSPDGKRLLALLGEGGPSLIDLTVPLDQRRPQPLPNSRQGDEVFMPTSWSADGRWIVGEVQIST